MTDHNKLIIRGARVHNLKNVSVEIPKNKLVVITGLSGSGKSSLAFDTIYAEGQRRYAESLSSYARQFMEVQGKPEVDRIDGLSPTIAIDQKISAQNPRSTVGTTTEIYDYLRLLFARAGNQYCPDCLIKVEIFTPGEITEKVRTWGRKHSGVISVYAPLVRRETVDAKVLLSKVERSGYEWLRVNGEELKINDLANFPFRANQPYEIDLLIGRVEDIKKQDPTRLVDTALDLGNGLVRVVMNEKTETFSTVGLCPKCSRQMPVLDLRSFSFNSPYGACQHCTGLGVTMEVDPNLVTPNLRLTLAEGAIQPWTRIAGGGQGQQKLLSVVAQKYNFSVHTPVGDLPAKVMDIILYGTGNEWYEVEGKKMVFTGVIPDLRQRHLSTTSDYLRKEIEQYMREQVCPVCQGKRLRRESLAVKFGDYNIADMVRLSIEELRVILEKDKKNSARTGAKAKICESVIREIIPRLNNLIEVGLGYLNLDRSVNTLSGGEITRVRLSSQLSSGLTGVIYVLDEPSVGLHPRDNEKLITALEYLRDLGNTVIVVEHDADMMRAADYLIDVGPGAGVLGGEIIAEGTIAQLKKFKNSATVHYLFGKKENILRKRKGAVGKEEKNISIIGAKAFNLKNINVNIPLGKLVCVTGVSGSGKSTLILDILGKALAKHFYRAKEAPGAHAAIKGISNIDKVVSVDQSPIGRTPRSNPATYTGIFTLVRDLFAGLSEAQLRGFDAGKFSFNVKGGGRCEACAGEGYVRIPMQFLADVYVDCNECGGQRYNQEALEIHYHNKNIAEVLKMTVEEAFKFFCDIPALAEKLNLLREIGLGYVELGQPATTLSGGEAQRIKLATELSRATTGRTLYILDEPTTGLHFEDIKRLLAVLNRLVEKGNTVLIIEHNTEVIGCADWIIDLGPEGGSKGGEIIAQGTPAEVARNKKSWTGRFLR